VPEGPALDLGSGGGVPGLVLAELWPDSEWVLLDADGRRAGFLDGAVLELGWANRVRVVHERAETAGHDAALRGRFALVCARAFGPPAVAAECGAPFLRSAGVLVVSDPPVGGTGRWPGEGLDELGLDAVDQSTPEAHFTVLSRVAPCPERFPRAPGIPARRPLF
jgi:16S rRNA (guanine527-N7)-methyltransferase